MARGIDPDADYREQVEANERALNVVPESLTDDEFAWVNGHLALCGQRAVRRGSPDDTSWMVMETIYH